ncbi:nuclear factor 7, brain [Esox lucius]|uniref:B30.2/SPRY domain-containing protein n=1 Tax=Esox lucius TaxID=8010 RepID=A0AAY5KZK2_ESOLU|nr:nuclear factor 7, brain [Esox lucius]
MKSAPDMLLKALSELDLKELKTFQWHVVNSDLGDLTNMPKGCLENTDRLDTVDKIMQNYGSSIAVKITKMVLEKIHRSDIAKTLESDPLTEEPVKKKNKIIDEGNVSELKDRLRYDLKLLQNKFEKCENISDCNNRMTQHNKNQLETTERRIEEEFEKLYEFLRIQKKERLAALNKEEVEKGITIGENNYKIQEQITSLQTTIHAVEEDLQKSTNEFLESYKDTQHKIETLFALPEPQLISGALIDVAQHLGNLQFQVWEQMRLIVKHSPVILDPNTAASTLRLSDNLTGVQHTAIEQEQIPDNPERFLQYAKVLGSVGYEKGSQKHSWEVEVGDQPEWNLGLAKESVNRKGEDLPASPEYGFWTIMKRGKKYTNGTGKALNLKSRPQRIRIQLHYDLGELSFYDSKDNTHIYTYKTKFTERVYPYISVWKIKDASNNELQICHSEISVTVKSCL